MNNMTISGVKGSLKWSYHEAGILGAWTVTTVDGVRRLSASIVKADTYRVSQRPLRFIATLANVSRTWPIVGELQIQGAQLDAVLGPMEK